MQGKTTIDDLVTTSIVAFNSSMCEPGEKARKQLLYRSLGYFYEASQRRGVDVTDRKTIDGLSSIICYFLDQSEKSIILQNLVSLNDPDNHWAKIAKALTTFKSDTETYFGNGADVLNLSDQFIEKQKKNFSIYLEAAESYKRWVESYNVTWSNTYLDQTDYFQIINGAYLVLKIARDLMEYGLNSYSICSVLLSVRFTAIAERFNKKTEVDNFLAEVMGLVFLTE